MGSGGGKVIEPTDLLKLFASEKYILWHDARTSTSVIVLKRGAKPVDQLRAWAHALLVATATKSSQGGKDLGVESAAFQRVKETLREVKEVFDGRCEEEMRRLGWDLEVAVLETREGVRVAVGEGEGGAEGKKVV